MHVIFLPKIFYIPYIGVLLRCDEMRCKTQTFPIILVALFLVISLAIVGFSVAGYESDEGSDVILRENTWSVYPKFIEVGESVTIEGEVENIGDERVDDYVDLYINEIDEDSRVDSEVVYLDPGETKTVTFNFDETEKTGTYEILVKLDHFEDQWESQFEVKLETVENIEIEPMEDPITIEAGETIDFSAKAYNNDNELMTDDDEDFIWYNTDNTGLFGNTEEGKYEVWAELEGVDSEQITVIVEPADPHQLVLVETPSENKITAGEVADYVVEVQDKYGNIQGEGEYTIALIVNEEIIPTATIEDGENRTSISWRTTRDPGEYKIRAIEEDDRLNSTEEHLLTVSEDEDDSILAGQWWMFPLSIVVIVAISLVYISDIKKKNHSLNILSSFSKKREPKTHEWKRNKEPEETSEGTED